MSNERTITISEDRFVELVQAERKLSAANMNVHDLTYQLVRLQAKHGEVQYVQNPR